jgi:hypothetical protein
MKVLMEIVVEAASENEAAIEVKKALSGLNVDILNYGYGEAEEDEDEDEDEVIEDEDEEEEKT